MFTDDGILETIRHYTREAGVRNLEREIGSCLRKIARKFVGTEDKTDFRVVIDAEKVQELLGTIRFRKQDIARKSEIGLGQRPGVDRGRRRRVTGRGDARQRQGRSDADRKARRGDAGIGQGRA